MDAYRRSSIGEAEGDLSLYDKARIGRREALDDEALQPVIEEDSSKTCGELARQFNISSKTVRLHLHRLGKSNRLSKWVPYTLLEVHKQQRVAGSSFIVACFLATVAHSYSIGC
ncbi:histone-lysine N-methyltransferase SETMAR [Trichonephila inaurata madagascariensis]|uniref:Histone-lysine N-methyltransferase SETMAR n=1 Tax=Trichonephila inaurata madagascariensis TaxID=2747483 RepID=A0A8X6YHX2_9ARAC|nr:histone-lysine N-methyltransferase SETMAR [Trichonephila inaurata madagascariensis]